MNKFFKVVVSSLGAINAIFSILIPIAVALILIVNTNLSEFTQTILIIAGLGSASFRAIKFLLPLI